MSDEHRTGKEEKSKRPKINKEKGRHSGCSSFYEQTEGRTYWLTNWLTQECSRPKVVVDAAQKGGDENRKKCIEMEKCVSKRWKHVTVETVQDAVRNQKIMTCKK